MARIAKLLPDCCELTAMSDPAEKPLSKAKAVFPEIKLFSTTEELLDTHIITDPDQYPPCTATGYDYFRMSGYYVGSYDYSRVADALYIQNGGFYYLKFDSAELCTEAIDILVSGGVFRDMEGVTSAYLYRTSLNGRILTIEIMYD